MQKPIQLEPMTMGMILDATFRLYSRHFWVILGIVAVAYVPQFALNLLALVADQFWDAWSLLVILLTVLARLVWWVVVFPLSTGAAAYVVSQGYLDQSVDVRQALQQAWDSLGTLVLTSIVVGLIVMGGLLLLIVPGVLWWLSYSLVIPVIMLESRGSEEARRRSRELTLDHRGKIFVVMLVMVFIQTVFQFGAMGVLAVFGATDVQGPIVQAGLAAVQIVMAPLTIIATILLYYDLRIRKEGFDLEVLSGAIQSPAPRSTLGLS